MRGFTCILLLLGSALTADLDAQPIPIALPSTPIASPMPAPVQPAEAAAKQWTPFEIAVCIVAGLLALAILGLWARSIRHKTLLTATRPHPNPSSQFAYVLQELETMTAAIDALTAQVTKQTADEQTAITAQNNAAAAIQALQATNAGLTTQIQTLQAQIAAQGNDEAAVPPLTQQLATSDGALAQSTGALIAATPPAAQG